MKIITVNNLDLQDYLNKPKKLDFTYDRVEFEFCSTKETYIYEKYNSWLELVCDLNVSQSIYMNKIHFKYIMENTSKLDINFSTLHYLVNAKCLDINKEDFEYILNICLETLHIDLNNIVALGSYLNEVVDKFDYDYSLEQLSIIKLGFDKYNISFISKYHEFKVRSETKIDNLISKKKNDLLLSKVNNNKEITKRSKI